MSIKSVKLPIFISRHEKDSYEKQFLPFLKTTELMECRSYAFDYDWIYAAKDTLVQYVLQGGKIRLLVSLDLSDVDRNAFVLFQEAEIEAIIKREVLDPLRRDIPYHELWRLQYLAYLVSEGIMDVRFSVPKPGKSRHDEMAFLSEGKDTICFHGSFFPKLDLLDAINVFVSWDQRDHLRIQEYRRTFEDEWKNKDDGFWTIRIPETLMNEIKSLKDSYNPFTYLLENKTKFKLRAFQNEAITKLEENGWRGIFVTPAGSSQQITALFALDQYILLQPRTVCLVVAPNLHALAEWEKLIRNKYPTKQLNIFTCEAEIGDSYLDETIRLKLREDFLFVLTTYKNYGSQPFQALIRKNKNYTFYIFDECHLLCRNDTISNTDILEESARIGLSSSSKSWLSEPHRKYLKTVFGDEIVDYPIKNLVGKGLNEYDYIPILSELIIPEYSEFRQLTSLAIRAGDPKKVNAANPNLRQEYLIQRERVLQKAYNKSVDFIQTYSSGPKKHVIVYTDKTLVDEIRKAIEFQHRVSVDILMPETPLSDRQKLFRNFQSWSLDVIVTAACFDEGVDTLDPVAIYMLSSPTSPRVFHQRRNRVLYPLQAKGRTKIYDFVTIAPRESLQDVMQVEVIKRELPRISELSREASVAMLGQLNEYLEAFNLNNVFQNSEPSELNQDIFVREENYLE